MPYDYSAPPPSRQPDLIPAGTVATVLIHLHPGGIGEDELLKRSDNGECEMLAIEYVVVDGEFARRKFWGNQIITGTTQGQKDMADAYTRMRGKILQSARGIKEGDTSPQSRAAYMADLKDFDGLMFIAKIGVEKGGPNKKRPGENFADKNCIAAVITPDNGAEWHPITQTPPFDGGGNSGAAASPSESHGTSTSKPPITPPDWAR